MMAPPTTKSAAPPRAVLSRRDPAIDCRSLDWDTEFFGSRMGALALARALEGEQPADRATLLEYDLRVALTQAQAQGFTHLIFRTPAEDLPAAWAAEQSGLRLVDIGLDSSFTFGTVPLPMPPTVPIRDARPDDVPTLRELAADSFRLSRFSADPFFTDEQVRSFHRAWLKNLVGGLAQAVLVCELGGETAGFVSCAMAGTEGRIPLIATDAAYRRRGVASGLVSAALRWFADAGARVVHVKTQSTNYPALALYHRAGFTVSKSELTFSVILSPVGSERV